MTDKDRVGGLIGLLALLSTLSFFAYLAYLVWRTRQEDTLRKSVSVEELKRWGIEVA